MTKAVPQWQGNVQPGDTVSVTFDSTPPAKPGTPPCVWSLTSYETPTASFVASERSDQVRVGFAETDPAAPTPRQSLQVKVASCFFQVDFAQGHSIQTLSSRTNYRDANHFLIAAATGGTTRTHASDTSFCPSGSSTATATLKVGNESGFPKTFQVSVNGGPPSTLTVAPHSSDSSITKSFVSGSPPTFKVTDVTDSVDVPVVPSPAPDATCVKGIIVSNTTTTLTTSTTEPSQVLGTQVAAGMLPRTGTEPLPMSELALVLLFAGGLVSGAATWNPFRRRSRSAALVMAALNRTEDR